MGWWGQRLASLAEHAFRRPLKKGELEPVVSMVYAKLDEGLSPQKPP